MVHKNAETVNIFLPALDVGIVTTGRLPVDYSPGGSGLAAPSPMTVVHGRTFHSLTRPEVTYGSTRANASTTSLDGAEKKRTPRSTGSASAPPSRSSPR